MYRVLVVLAVLVAAIVWTGTAGASATTFSYTGGEQTYTVPAGVRSVSIIAVGARGGGRQTCCLAAGRGALVSGIVSVTPGQTVYVEVGGVGGSRAGGFNGGGDGGMTSVGSAPGGGGASDVRTLPMSAGVSSLDSRLIVAAGGGGSAYPAAAGGDAGQPGSSSPGSSIGGGAGTQTAGGAGGCDALMTGCGMAGSLGNGGAGGSSGQGGAQARSGSGAGGGLYGGGGGGGVLCTLAVGCQTRGGEVGGGGGGSSLVPSGGSLTLARLATPPSVVIATGPARTTAAVAITGIRVMPVSPGCATETGTKEHETRAGAADATCRHFRLTVRGAIRAGGRLAPAGSGRLTVTVTAILPRGETMRAAQGSVSRGGWRVSLILPGVNLDPLPPRYLIIVRYHGDGSFRPASAARHARVETERAAV